MAGEGADERVAARLLRRREARLQRLARLQQADREQHLGRLRDEAPAERIGRRDHGFGGEGHGLERPLLGDQQVVRHLVAIDELDDHLLAGRNRDARQVELHLRRDRFDADDADHEFVERPGERRTVGVGQLHRELVAEAHRLEEGRPGPVSRRDRPHVRQD